MLIVVLFLVCSFCSFVNCPCCPAQRRGQHYRHQLIRVLHFFGSNPKFVRYQWYWLSCCSSFAAFAALSGVHHALPFFHKLFCWCFSPHRQAPVLQELSMGSSWGRRYWNSIEDSTLLGWHTLATTNSLFLAKYALTLCSIFVGSTPARMQLMLDLIFCQASLYAHHSMMWSTLDGQVYGISLTKCLFRRIFSPRQHLCISDIVECRPWRWLFNSSQLHQLHHQFDLDFVLAHNETGLQIGTGHWTNGRERCYHIDPEELFLFSLTKCKTSMTNEKIINMVFGGDYNRWTYGFCQFMLYLDLRYPNIIGQGGLLRFLPQFGVFRNKIEEYCQRDWWYHNHQGNFTWVPGIEKLP